MLKHCAAKACADFLIPHARELASHIERFPLGWDIKDSRTRLGCCSSRGIITLSPRLIFLPTHLADYIIYHELAHLSEMNHSAAFHEVCDSYCDGKEEQYRAEVKAFKFPVFNHSNARNIQVSKYRISIDALGLHQADPG